ncbi:MAG: hypothetical protein ACYCWN_02195 [Ferrimicrobium sp.]|jgi:hypothetical protein|uniref:Uncharacterized protein n=1 Tax=Ferrimicrobium acidiphilum TaxID=121039 RepID=A0ABV3Y185_9ACTN|nr:hypothetical protein [Ferrimicrobium sp.]
MRAPELVPGTTAKVVMDAAPAVACQPCVVVMRRSVVAFTLLDSQIDHGICGEIQAS